MYVLVSGRVGIWSGGERGDPVLLAILGPGEMFGEMAILSNERVRTASSAGAVEGRGHPDPADRHRERCVSGSRGSPTCSSRRLLRLVQRLTTQVSELSELDSSTRLYRQLWRLGEVYEKRRVGAEIPISQQQLASMTGVGLRITNRVLNEARAEGILETGKKRIVVNDWTMVRRRAGLRFRSG